MRFATPQYTSMGVEVLLASYGGDPTTTGWTIYTLPLAVFNLAGAPIGGLVIQDESGRLQPAVYVDDIAFINQGVSGSVVHTPATLTPRPGLPIRPNGLTPTPVSAAPVPPTPRSR